MWETHANLLYFTIHSKNILPKMDAYTVPKNILHQNLQKIEGIEEITCYKKYQMSITIGKMFNNVEDLARIKQEVNDALAIYFSLPAQLREEYVGKEYGL